MIRNQTKNCQLSLLLILLLLLVLVGRVEMFYTRLRLLFSTVNYIFGLVSTKLSPSDKRLDQTLSEKYDIFPQVSHAFLNFKLWSWSILLLIYCLFYIISQPNRTPHHRLSQPQLHFFTTLSQPHRNKKKCGGLKVLWIAFWNIFSGKLHLNTRGAFSSNQIHQIL